MFIPIRHIFVIKLFNQFNSNNSLLINLFFSSIEDSPGLDRSIQRRVRSTGRRLSRHRLLGTSSGLGRSEILDASPAVSEISPNLSEVPSSVSRKPASSKPANSLSLVTSSSLRLFFCCKY